MAYYSASRIGVTLDGKSIFASDVKVELSPDIESSVLEDERAATNQYLPKGPLRGELSLVYFLTGKDFVKDYFVKDAPISGSVGGLYFSSGYLTSYSFSFAQFQPVKVSAVFQFYGTLEGDFNPSSDYADVDSVLDYSKAVINASGIGGVDKVVSAQYEFAAETTPSYLEGSLLPNDIIYGDRVQKFRMETYLISGKTIAEANDANVEVLLRDDELNVTDSFTVSGKVISLSTDVSVGENAYSSFQISQNGVGGVPAISSFSPTTASSPGISVTINGSNFNGVTDVFFFDTRVDSFEVNSTRTQITTTVPSQAISGPIKVMGIGGAGTSSSNFLVTNNIGVG
jgi:hypothetical protein